MAVDLQKTLKWQRWLKQIEGDISHILGSRQIYKSYGVIVKSNQVIHNQGNVFHSWVVNNYVTTVSMAVRRQLDTDSDTISLARLISDIRDNPKCLTRSWYVEYYKNSIEGYGDQMFNEYAGLGECIDISVTESDLALLLEAGKDISKLANRSFAHKSTRTKPKMTFDDVDMCIESIKKIAQKYILLLTASHNVLEPIMSDWQGIFTIPWVKQDD
jgi:AbiU2